MAEYHVGCGIAGIYCGTVKKNGEEWLNKNECTEEATNAVRDWMCSEFLRDGKTSGGWEWTKKDGTVIQMNIRSIKKEE